MTINNITGSNSLQSNCEPDESTSMLTNIHDFITMYQQHPTDPQNERFQQIVRHENHPNINPLIVSDNESDDDELSLVAYEPEIDVEMGFLETHVDLSELQVISNAASRVCQKLFKTTKCKDCKDNFDLTDQKAMLESIETLLCKINEIIPNICFEESIKQKLVDRIKTVKIHVIGCAVHNEEIERKVKSLSVVHVIHAFCNEMNKILSGKTKTLPENPSDMHKLALEHRQKKKRIGKFTDKFIDL